MRLKKEMIHYISEVIVNDLVANKRLELQCTKEDLVERVNRIMVNDLSVEDKLNDEVKEIMRSYAEQISKENVDYGKMFQMIKNRLARERKIIL